MRVTPALAQVHLDPLGGMAGDMFIAAVLDAWPDLEPVVDAAVEACALPHGWQVVHERRLSAGLDARGFDVRGPHPHEPHQRHGHEHDSGHYADIVRRVEAMPLTAGARRHALGIYRALGECEAHIHGIELARVHFHELADWDSLVDIVCAGALIDALGSPRWSYSPVPLGGGVVRTAHGPLPVPAPATARLLEGFEVRDDGIDGERVTPTGAAILAWLAPHAGRAGLSARLGATGMGAGTRTLDGVANVLRVQGYLQTAAAEPVARDVVGVLAFDVDDQTPEDLASGLDAVRAVDGVLDVTMRTAYGKKGRAVFEVRVLCRPEAVETVAQACLEQSTTLGVRVQHAERRVLQRSTVQVEVDGAPLDVKLSVRPSGAVTAKAEHDQVAARGVDARDRREVASRAEQAARARDGR